MEFREGDGEMNFREGDSEMNFREGDGEMNFRNGDGEMKFEGMVVQVRLGQVRYFNYNGLQVT